VHDLHVHVGGMLVILNGEEELEEKCRRRRGEVCLAPGSRVRRIETDEASHETTRHLVPQQIDRIDNLSAHLLHIPSQDYGYQPQTYLPSPDSDDGGIPGPWSPINVPVLRNGSDRDR
jgi:hypothetical protein